MADDEGIDTLPDRLRAHGRVETALARIRPLLQADGVDVELVEVRENSASVRLTGLCSTCGAASLNLHTGLEAMLREEVQGFGELRLVTDGDVGTRRARPSD